MILLNEQLWFPPLDFSDEDGLLAVGGDLQVERLLLAYHEGIFPWFNEGNIPLWWSPKNRMVVDPEHYRMPKSMRKVMRSNEFQFTWNERFPEVIRMCRHIERNGQDGTWITDEIISAYEELHKLGWAKSIEVYKSGFLVGGLYGIDLGHVFCGESMFSLVSNASKAGFIFLIENLKNENYKLLDCQIYNEHLHQLGAFEIPRDEFLKILKKEKHKH